MFNTFQTTGNVKDDDKSIKKKEEKRKMKEQCKLEKRRLKEEKLKKVAEDREKKKKKTKNNLSITYQPTLDNFVQSENNVIPLLLEKCVKFIEVEGLESEGLYRVPGNRSHVELLFQKFDEGINLININ